MSNEIKEFLGKLENWKENFEIKEYDTKNNSSDISQIITMQREKDVDGLLAFWDKKLDKDYFELAHPEYSNITTRATINYHDGIVNLVFMTDRKNLYPWILCQRWNMIDVCVTQNFLYEFMNIECSFFDKLSEVSKLNIEDVLYGDKNFRLIVSKTRPYHFFYDQLKYLYAINNKNIKKDTYFNNPFLQPINFANYNRNKEKVFLFPSCIQNNQLNQFNNTTVKELNEQMEKYVYEDALKDFNPILYSSDSLKLWYGITGQKRSWLEQIEGCEKIVLKLLEYYPKIEIFIDGMTATEGKTLENKDDQEVYDQISSRLKEKCTVISLIGKDYRHKIQVCSTTDIFIANAGTGCMVPLRFCKKAGVLHSNSNLITFPDTYPDTIKFFDKDYEIDVIDSEKKDSQFRSYHIPWQHIFNLTAEVLNQIKGTNIKSLDVPPVQELLSDEEIKEQKNISFTNLESIIKPAYKSPDILREVALAFEKSDDITTAKTIMQKAHELRPNGPFIKQKLDEYKKILGEKK